MAGLICVHPAIRHLMNGTLCISAVRELTLFSADAILLLMIWMPKDVADVLNLILWN